MTGRLHGRLSYCNYLFNRCFIPLTFYQYSLVVWASITMGVRPLLLLLPVLMLCLVHLCSSCVERERRALLSFKRSLIDPSNRLSNWVGQNCCEWVGVECNNETAHVVDLDLSNPQSYPLDGRDNSSLVGSVVDPSLMELKHLESLDLSYNNFAGSEIPKFIGNFTKLRVLWLIDARFGGAVPASLGNLSKLESLDLRGNSLTGVVSEIHFERLSRLDLLHLGSNSLVFKISSNWIPPFQLSDIHLDSCLVGPRFPHWLRNQSRIADLSLFNASISDSIPEWFPNIASNLNDVDLSCNQIHGLVPDLSRNITNSMSSLSLDLSSNNLEGPLPPFPSNTIILDISNNFISGSLPQNISDMMPDLEYLILSNNSISGSIPTSLCKISELSFINLSNNNFSGEIPQNCWSNLELRNFLALANNNLTGVIPSSNFSNICDLRFLSLRNNNFYGEIPLALRNCKYLETFVIAQNGFSGNILSWISQLSNLAFLSLRSNKFEGSIAPELCRAENIRVLDLAENRFSGTILPCFKNFTSMKLGHELNEYLELHWFRELNQEMKGRDLLYTTTLSFLVNLDLSSNNLRGLIPKELTLLTGLRGLNLSNNQLIGEIPKEIGNLRLLESLDFSNNLLTGVIPQSISELTSISYLDLSYNNLSGQIPTGHQLQTLEPWIYSGNPSLCGMQIEKMCAKDEPIRRNCADKQLKDRDFEMVWFYISMVIGFVVGFWGVWGVLFCKKSWRATYFRFVENVHDLVLVQVGQLCRA